MYEVVHMTESLHLPCREYLQIVVMQSPPERPVYLLGESFGGVLALAVAESRPDLVSANSWQSLLYCMQNAPSGRPHSNSSHPDGLMLKNPHFREISRAAGCACL
jgi:alpha-beta hydrolase superfamily lysophospholipase